MTRSTNMEHVEVLERLRDRWAVPDERVALDAAIAALSANVAHATAELQDEIETLRAALESLRAHMGNAVMNRDGIIKVLEKTRDEQGDEIHRLRAEVDRLRGELRGEHVRVLRDRNAATARAERLAEALQWYVDNDDTNDGQEGNEFWLAGRDRARALLRDQEVGNE